MSETSAQRKPAFDAFGEPIGLSTPCVDGRGYGGTRRTAIVFWVLALLLVGSRAYFSDRATVPDAVVKALQVSGLR